MEREISRRSFLKKSAIALGTLAACDFKGMGSAFAARQDKSQVFFTKDMSVNGLLKIYSKVNRGMTGKVGIKLHSGEPHGANLLPIKLIKGLQPHIPNSAIVECNVLYPSPRQTTKGHRETLKINGFDFCPVDIMDADGHVTLPIPGMREFFDAWSDPTLTERPFTPGVHLTEVAVGKNLLNYDSLFVYTHFKGHTSGGFGGSLKNIAIGCASGQVGKRQIHGEGWPKRAPLSGAHGRVGQGDHRAFRPTHHVYQCAEEHLRRLRLQSAWSKANLRRYRHTRFNGYFGHRQGFGRFGVCAAGRATTRYCGTHRVPKRAAPA